VAIDFAQVDEILRGVMRPALEELLNNQNTLRRFLERGGLTVEVAEERDGSAIVSVSVEGDPFFLLVDDTTGRVTKLAGKFKRARPRRGRPFTVPLHYR
jgi:hypothetical protein